MSQIKNKQKTAATVTAPPKKRKSKNIELNWKKKLLKK